MSSRPSLESPPDIRLFGKVDEAMLSTFLQQLAQAPIGQPLTLELSTTGGNADIGRRIAWELGSLQQYRAQEISFVGKTFVYSAGVTIMSSFAPARRFLTADCELLIHERKMQKTLHLDGALRGCRSVVQDALAEIDSGQRLEREGFAALVAGTPLGLDDVMAKVLERDWYLTAAEALRLGLIAAVL